MQHVGERIRELRLVRGLSQSDLGRGRYSGSYISHIESGRRRPNNEVLAYLAEQLGLSVTDLDPNDTEAKEAELTALLATIRRLLQTHQWDEAARVAQQASYRATEMQRPIRRWEADLLLATALMSSGRYAQAAELATELATRPVMARANQLRAEARTLAARALRASGRLADAADQARAALEDAAGDPKLASAALTSLLAALELAGRSEQSKLVQAQLAALVAGLDDHDAAIAAWALGNAAFSNGDVAAGLAWHERSAELCDPRVDLLAWARLRKASAYYLVAQADTLDQAQQYFDQSAPILMLAGEPGDLADLRLVQARLDLTRGDYQQASQLLEHLVADAASMDDVRLEGDIRQCWAEALLADGQLHSGREQLRLAAGCFERAQAPQQAAKLWRRYAATGVEVTDSLA